VHRIETFIHIDAPLDRVWAILADFERYPEWNPFVTAASGPLVAGGRLKVRIAPMGKKAMEFSPEVLHVEPERELRWRGKLLFPGLFDGEHAFRLTQTPEGVRLDHFERFSGILAPLLWRSLEGPTRAGFVAMNEALKLRAENPPRSVAELAA
jgi:hypothetical protein